MQKLFESAQVCPKSVRIFGTDESSNTIMSLQYWKTFSAIKKKIVPIVLKRLNTECLIRCTLVSHFDHVVKIPMFSHRINYYHMIKMLPSRFTSPFGNIFPYQKGNDFLISNPIYKVKIFKITNEFSENGIRPNGRNIYLKTIDIKLYYIIDTKKECTFIILRFIPSILCFMIHW